VLLTTLAVLCADEITLVEEWKTMAGYWDVMTRFWSGDRATEASFGWKVTSSKASVAMASVNDPVLTTKF